MKNRRRDFLKVCSSIPFLGYVQLSDAQPWVSDVHSHFGMSKRTRHLSLREELEKNHITLFSWAFGADGFAIQRNEKGRIDVTRSVTKGEFYDHFLKLTRFMHTRLKAEGLLVLKEPIGIDQALKGEIRVVLSTEGAYFIEGDLENLQKAYDLGYRQIGLGHFVESELTDVRTEPPKLQGLSALGKAVIAKCNELGILIDLAHSTDQAVEQALDVSRAPMLWSHSTIIPRMSSYRSRRDEIMALFKGTAEKLAAKGGVVGIWPSLVNYNSIADYGDGIRQLIDWVGDDHLAFGTDMDGLGPFELMRNRYADLSSTVEYLVSKGVSETTLHKISIGNYARILKAVFEAKKTL
jgi:membrane dipeptidase